jgi:hypothetical protein
MATKSEALQAWTDAYDSYVDTVAKVLMKARHESHELDVIEALARDVERTFKAYRAARGESSAV